MPNSRDRHTSAIPSGPPTSPARVRIVFDATYEYRTELRLLSARKNQPISQLIFHALEKTYNIKSPK